MVPIQILGLRSFFSKKYQTQKLKEKWLGIEFESTQKLFKNLPTVIESIPVEERYNLFYTVAHLGHRKRKEFISTDVVVFDIDKINVLEKEAYLDLLAVALKVDLKKCGVVWSGNGIHIIIQLKESVGIDFYKNISGYQYYVNRINKSLEEAGLHGKADSVFDTARVLRLPFTKNIKPMEFPESPDSVTKECSLYAWDLVPQDFGLPIQALPERNKEGKTPAFGPIDTKSVLSECLFLRYAKENPTEIREPAWSAALGVTAWFKDSDNASHSVSQEYPGYTREDTQHRCDRKREETSGPTLCKTIDEQWGGCKDCPWNGKIKTPLQIKSVDFSLHELDFVDPNAKTTEMQVVVQLLKQYGIKYNHRENSVDSSGGILAQQSGELFLYNGKIWEKLEEEAMDAITHTIDKFYFMKAGNTKVETTFKKFMKYIPRPPVKKNFHQPNPELANFNNGTLHLKRDSNGTYFVEFKKHNKEDYLTYVINGDYDLDNQAKNEKFDLLINQVFENDIDKDQKIRAIAQMYGAALMPAFPHLFFLHGIIGSKKSTVAGIIRAFVDEKDICGVPPHEFDGFNMESMAGKLVNIVTDVKSNCVISDEVVKQIEDRVVHRIQRKYQKDIYAPFPSLHIFGANKLPKTFEGASHAHDRRWTFIRFNNSITINTQDFIREYWPIIAKAGIQAILNFAVKGLLDLIKSNGHFASPSSGIADLQNWQEENDIAAQFFNSFGEGALEGLSFNEEKSIRRNTLWQLFCRWRDESGRKYSKMTNNAFYTAIEEKGYKWKTIHGYKCYKGFENIDIQKIGTAYGNSPKY